MEEGKCNTENQDVEVAFHAYRNEINHSKSLDHIQRNYQPKEYTGRTNEKLQVSSRCFGLQKVTETWRLDGKT